LTRIKGPRVAGAYALLTTPGAGKWYRSAGASAPRCACKAVRVSSAGILCLGRTGSGERFRKGEIGLDNRLRRDGKLVWRDAVEPRIWRT
jgi:urease accessory protein